MSRILVLVVVFLLSQFSFAISDVDRTLLRKFVQNNYEKIQTEESFITYVAFLIHWGREDNNPAWLDEASVLISEHNWNSSQKRIEIEREFHWSRAAFFPLPERYDYLLKNNSTNPMGKDSLFVVFETTKEQVENFRNGKATPAAIFTKETKIYWESELDNKLHYLEIMLTYGKAVYFTDSIFLKKANSLLNEVRVNPYASEDLRFHTSELRYYLIQGDFTAAETKLEALKRFEGLEQNEEELKRVLIWIGSTYGRYIIEDSSGNSLENLGIAIDRIRVKGSECQPKSTDNL